jgi:hypothetical protein
VEAAGYHINKNRPSVQIADHFGGRGKGVGRKENQIPAFNTAGFQGQMETTGSGIYRQAGKSRF